MRSEIKLGNYFAVSHCNNEHLKLVLIFLSKLKVLYDLPSAFIKHFIYLYLAEISSLGNILELLKSYTLILCLSWCHTVSYTPTLVISSQPYLLASTVLRYSCLRELRTVEGHSVCMLLEGDFFLLSSDIVKFDL